VYIKSNLTAIPAYPANVVDVTGAGDAFSGAFAAGLWQTGDPLRSALMGAVAASVTIEGYGALYALNAQRATLNRRLDELAGRVQRD
jgi:sugar/nucleoside kinase (ribokinase family)